MLVRGLPELRPLEAAHSHVRAWIDDVFAYAGVAAVDVYLGATDVADADPLNLNYPGEFRYGGGHVIADLVAGKKVLLSPGATGRQPSTRADKTRTWIIEDLNVGMATATATRTITWRSTIGPDDLHVPGGSGAPGHERELLLRGPAVAAVERSVLRDHRRRDAHLAGGARGYVFGEGTQHAGDFANPQRRAARRGWAPWP